MVTETAKFEQQIIEAVDISIQDMVKNRKAIYPLQHMKHITYNILSLFAFEKM